MEMIVLLLTVTVYGDDYFVAVTVYGDDYFVADCDRLWR